MKPNKLIKAEKAFDYACKQASNCRHKTYQVSCFACKSYETCEIQKRINKNLEIKQSFK